MDKRQRPRYPSHFDCEVATSQVRAPGLVRDVSNLGLFVETPATPTLASVVKLIFRASDSQPAFCIEAGVARTRFETPDPQTSTPSIAHGVGLEVIPPRTEFERWLVRPARPQIDSTELNLSPLESLPPGGMRKYRIRLIRHDRPGSQCVTICAESESTARTQAIRRLGNPWRVVESQPL